LFCAGVFALPTNFLLSVRFTNMTDKANVLYVSSHTANYSIIRALRIFFFIWVDSEIISLPNYIKRKILLLKIREIYEREERHPRKAFTLPTLTLYSRENIGHLTKKNLNRFNQIFSVPIPCENFPHCKLFLSGLE